MKNAKDNLKDYTSRQIDYIGVQGGKIITTKTAETKSDHHILHMNINISSARAVKSDPQNEKTPLLEKDEEQSKGCVERICELFLSCC